MRTKLLPGLLLVSGCLGSPAAAQYDSYDQRYLAAQRADPVTRRYWTRRSDCDDAHPARDERQTPPARSSGQRKPQCNARPGHSSR